MKHLIKHLVHEHLLGIAAKSLLNCHVHGLHSIMLIDTPEKRVRLFVTDASHRLHLNTGPQLGSLAAHAHHCNITLHMVKGTMSNLEYRLRDAARFQPYFYVSGILNNEGSFHARHGQAAYYYDSQLVDEGESLFLPAHFIHSVFVPEGAVAAWFVYEGAKDPNYLSYSYSDQNLELTPFEGLYQPMTQDDVLLLLRSANLI